MNEYGVGDLNGNKKKGGTKVLVVLIILIVLFISGLTYYKFIYKNSKQNNKPSEVKNDYLKVSDSKQLIVETINDEDDGKFIAKIIVDVDGNVYIDGEFKNDLVSDKIGKTGNYKIKNYNEDTTNLYKTDFINVKSVYAYKDKNSKYNVILINEDNTASIITLQVGKTASIDNVDVHKDVAKDIVTVTKDTDDDYLLIDSSSKKYVVSNGSVKEKEVKYITAKSSYTESEVIIDQDGIAYLSNNNVKENVLNKISEKGTYKSYKIDEKKEDTLYKLNISNIRDVYYIEGNNKEVIALISKDNKLSIITFILDINKQVIDVKEQKELKDNIVSMSKTYNGTKYEYKFVTKDNKFYEFVIDEDKNTTEKPKNSVGDVNLDGIVDVFDLVRIQKYVNKQVDLTKESIDNADINKDGKIDNIDVILLKKYLAGYKMKLPYLKYKVGDIDLDGKITGKDVAALQKYLAKAEGATITDEGLVNADINLDGNIDNIDVGLLKKYLAGYKIDLPYLKYKVGDANLDGTLDAFDLVRIKKYLAKQVELTDEAKINADVNLDGNVDYLDEALLKKYLAGYKMDLPYLKYKVGDANLDGTVDAFDLVRIKKYISKQVELTDEAKINADINLDGNIDNLDEALLKKYLAGYKIDLPYLKYKPGDIDLDGKITGKDVAALQRYLAKTEGATITDEGLVNADINLDGNTDAVDVGLLRKYLAGYKMDLPYLKYKVGDVNLDGTVDAFDLVRIKKYLAKQVELTDESKINADVNLDGNIDNIDVYLLKNYLAGNIEELPYLKYKAGDADLDGEVTAKDSIVIKRYAANFEGTTITGEGLINADVNLDGNVDDTDAETIRKYLLGGHYDSLPIIQN